MLALPEVGLVHHPELGAGRHGSASACPPCDLGTWTDRSGGQELAWGAPDPANPLWLPSSPRVQGLQVCLRLGPGWLAHSNGPSHLGGARVCSCRGPPLP